MRQMPTQYYTQIKRSFFHHGNQRFKLDQVGVVEAMKGVYSSMRLCQVFSAAMLYFNKFSDINTG